MAYTLNTFLMNCWGIWSELFAPLPFGDPYLAGGLPVIFFAIACWVFISGGARP